MTCIPSTPYSRDLGDELRQIRDKLTPHNGTWMAELLGWDQSKVSNVENGKVRASEIDLVQYLTTCGKDREYVEDFLDRYRNAFDAYFVQVPENLRTMALAESTADTITSYDMSVIPGLLQTEDYARELCIGLGVLTEEEIAAAVRFRMDRQAILRRQDRPKCIFFVHENALRLQVGGEKIMREQIKRLLFRTHTLRIVPDSSGPSAAFSNLVLWRYERAAPVVFTSSDVAKVFVQDAAAVGRCQSIFERLDAIAMDAGQSRKVLMDLVSQPREDLNGQGIRLAQEQL
ncbi:helix-turn-helix domain-containing protein [Lentzea tibetensis]|uniref:Helix-turn-helix domain-containing protein n=1 Tax=Lentzea tibetensis TaxID=2591470 RepID=A0A563EF32_9PSEU|nr:helix-turn-helix transcriptional regulator [Lentzea tibetensis]TWP43774.1 helix-turn-helix domain-containing protein [Lentzea tibetensis]